MPSFRRLCVVLSYSIVPISSGCGSSDSIEPTGNNLSTRTVGVPDGWSGGTGNNVYRLGLERNDVHGGSNAAYISTTSGNPTTFGVLAQSVKADNYRGRRLRWSGWVRHANITGNGGGLWFRVDGPRRSLSFDNMDDRPLLGSGDWKHVSVVLDVPENSVGLAVGVLLHGSGDLIVDDLKLEVVGLDVPSTNKLSPSDTVSADSSTIAAVYARAATEPANLNFEGFSFAFPGTSVWIGNNAARYATTLPGSPIADLEPLRQMVGTARMVGLGEGTHGTREFFQLKHRVFEFLVREMGFTHFAIEATWPESNAVNRYVLTGQGNSAVLLGDLYFWTWNTNEVLDLIEWMRDWNRTAAVERRVQFLGFDMQSPGAAIDTVRVFLERIEPTQVEYVNQRLSCLASYRNYRSSRPQPITDYAAQPDSIKVACRNGLAELHTFITSRRAVYEGATSVSQYENLLRSARLAQQFEEMASASGNSTVSGRLRDRFMAENAQWLLDQAGPGARMMLWAHNYHVSRVSGAMGDWLSSSLGADYLNLAFLFGRGRFNAIGPSLSGSLRAWDAQQVPANSLEALFLETGAPRLLLDTRRIASGGPAAAPLLGPIRMRSIGAVFDPNAELFYFVSHVLPLDFDLLMFVSATNETRLLR